MRQPKYNVCRLCDEMSVSLSDSSISPGSPSIAIQNGNKIRSQWNTLSPPSSVSMGFVCAIRQNIHLCPGNNSFCVIFCDVGMLPLIASAYDSPACLARSGSVGACVWRHNYVSKFQNLPFLNPHYYLPVTARSPKYAC